MLMKGDIPRNENGVRMQIIEFITFDIEKVSKKYTFSSFRREFSSGLSNCWGKTQTSKDF